MLPAKVVVLPVLGCHSFLGALFWMRWAWTNVTFWLWCCHMSSDKSCLNKARLWGGSNAFVHCTHLFWGKTLLQRYVWGGRCVESVSLLQCQAFWKQNAAVLPTNPLVYVPFLLFCGAERWPHPFFLWRGDFLLHSESLALTPLYNWAICQSVEVDCVSHMELETEPLLVHPCPIKGEDVLTESCIPVLFSYVWSHHLVFQTLIIPKLFLLEILFRANLLTLTLRSPQKAFPEAVCMHKWAVKKAKLDFL